MPIDSDQLDFFELQRRSKVLCEIIGWREHSRDILRFLICQPPASHFSERALVKATSIPRSTLRRSLEKLEGSHMIKRSHGEISLSLAGALFFKRAYTEIVRISLGNQVGFSRPFIQALVAAGLKGAGSLEDLEQVSFAPKLKGKVDLSSFRA